MAIASTAADPDRLLNEIQAAQVLGLSSRTLQAWRSQGIGPAYVRAGRAIRYRRADLTSWADQMTVVPAHHTHAQIVR